MTLALKIGLFNQVCISLDIHQLSIFCAFLSCIIIMNGSLTQTRSVLLLLVTFLPVLSDNMKKVKKFRKAKEKTSSKDDDICQSGNCCKAGFWTPPSNYKHIIEQKSSISSAKVNVLASTMKKRDWERRKKVRQKTKTKLNDQQKKNEMNFSRTFVKPYNKTGD